MGGGSRVYEEVKNINSNETFTVTCGFRPRIILLQQGSLATTAFMSMQYNRDIAEYSIIQAYYYNSGSNKQVSVYSVETPVSYQNSIQSITDTGFTCNLGSESKWYGDYHITCIE